MLIRPTTLRLLLLVVQLGLLATLAASLTSPADAVIAALQVTDDCSSCIDLLAALQSVAVQGDDQFVSLLTGICIDTGVRSTFLVPQLKLSLSFNN